MNILLLVLLFETKHLLCDFFWQTSYHLGKFQKNGWVLPLAHHCMIHALATAWIAFIVCPERLIPCVILDFTIHFIMDRIKAAPHLMGRWKSLDAHCYVGAVKASLGTGAEADFAKQKLQDNKRFWYCIGIDQYVHQLTNILMVWLLI